MADAVVPLDGTTLAESYLNIDAVIEAALSAGADAVHPGYGFLSESGAFARACHAAGLVFVGPAPAAIDTMGDKIRAKLTVAQAGVPVVPGHSQHGLSDRELVEAAREVGYPLLLKPSAGGGGKGMRFVEHPDFMSAAIDSARREAMGAFGDDTLLVERFIASPRHIEVQILGDQYGRFVHLGERECSLQRRHQKIVEEAPSSFLDAERREAMCVQAIEAARACGYTNAGTVEFIVSGEDPGQFYFLEMNTRLQVEHPVTELVWDVDLVEHQLRVAAGQPLPFEQDDLHPAGHAIEARIYAEDPANGFLPSAGPVLLADYGRGQGIRVDAGVDTDDRVSPRFDPMIAKVIAHGPDRRDALARLDRALADTSVLGLATNVAFLRALLAEPDVVDGRLDAHLVETRLGTWRPPQVPASVVRAAGVAALLSTAARAGDLWDQPTGWRFGSDGWFEWRAQSAGGSDHHLRCRSIDEGLVEIEGFDGTPQRVHAQLEPHRIHLGAASMRIAVEGMTTWVSYDGHTWRLDERQLLPVGVPRDATDGTLTSPMPGQIVAIEVGLGDAVVEGQRLVTLEAMKMEHTLTAPFCGTVVELPASLGAQVPMGAPLIVIEPAVEDQED